MAEGRPLWRRYDTYFGQHPQRARRFCGYCPRKTGGVIEQKDRLERFSSVAVCCWPCYKAHFLGRPQMAFAEPVVTEIYPWDWTPAKAEGS